MHRSCKAETTVQFCLGALSFKTPMSLISQKDRQMVIEALEYYVETIDEERKPQYQTLLNWIRLEYFKHEN